MPKNFYGYFKANISNFPTTPTYDNIYVLGLVNNVVCGGAKHPFLYYWNKKNDDYAEDIFISTVRNSNSPQYSIGFHASIWQSESRYVNQAIIAVDSGSKLDELLSKIAPVIETSYISGTYRFKKVIDSLLIYDPPQSGDNRIVSHLIDFEIENERYIGFIFRQFNSNNEATSIRLVKQDETFTDYSLEEFTNAFSNKIINFGIGENKIPTVIYNWFISQTEAIYPYTYTVKSTDGETILAQAEELPPIRSVSLSSLGNDITMTLTGSNSKDYVLKWSHIVPAEMIFLGLGYKTTDKHPSIPNGTTTNVVWNSDTTLYEVYGKYKPLSTRFEIHAYKSSAEQNRVDKTNFLTADMLISGVLREASSLIHPSITFTSDTIPTFNYVYIPIFNRYYYVTDITSIKNKLWQMSLTVDVLMTYKEALLACTGYIDRNENEYNGLIPDNMISLEKGETIETVALNNELFTSTRGSYVIQGLLIGAGNEVTPTDGSDTGSSGGSDTGTSGGSHTGSSGDEHDGGGGNF